MKFLFFYNLLKLINLIKKKKKLIYLNNIQCKNNIISYLCIKNTKFNNIYNIYLINIFWKIIKKKLGYYFFKKLIYLIIFNKLICIKIFNKIDAISKLFLSNYHINFI